MDNPRFVIFYTLKGGQGKTTLAVQYALFHNLNFITNDIASGSEQIFKPKFPPEAFQISLPGDSTLIFDPDSLNVLDLGGFVDKRCPFFFKNAAAVVIPVGPRQLDFLGFFNSLKFVEDYTKKIVVVINNADEKILTAARKDLSEALKNRYDVFVVRESSYFEKFILEDKDIFKINEYGIVKIKLEKLQGQLLALFDGINKLAKLN
jgi:cellulose biosynthesis protein BcsQ